MTSWTLLVVGSDNDLRTILVEQLQMHCEFCILQTDKTRNAIETIAQQHVDLVIIDVDRLDLSGCDAVELLRQQAARMPIIMLAAGGADCDAVLSLEEGANDCVMKPFRFSVLLVRIRAQLRQHAQAEETTFQLGRYLFKPRQKLLIGQHDRVRLTEKETAIIECLYRAGNNIMSRSTLLAEVWGYNSGITTHTLETHVYRLRQKIEQDPSNAKILMTDSGGYRLMT